MCTVCALKSHMHRIRSLNVNMVETVCLVVCLCFSRWLPQTVKHYAVIG
jgi:hypothetical protein